MIILQTNDQGTAVAAVMDTRQIMITDNTEWAEVEKWAAKLNGSDRQL